MIIELGKVTAETKHPHLPIAPDNVMGDFGLND